MPESVHGHEVMRMMVEEGGVYTRATLEAAIHARFGQGARFHTCSADEMDATALIAFLESRGKFLPAGAGFRTEASRICNH
jgi:probable metal-binding protein